MRCWKLFIAWFFKKLSSSPDFQKGSGFLHCFPLSLCVTREKFAELILSCYYQVSSLTCRPIINFLYQKKICTRFYIVALFSMQTWPTDVAFNFFNPTLVTPETFFGAQSLPVKPKFYPFCSTFLSGFYSLVNPLKCENEFTNICEWTQKRTQKFLWIIQKPFIFLTLENVYYIQVICVTDATIIEKLHSRISGEEEQLKEPEPYKSSSANKTRRMAIVTPARSELNWPQSSWCVFLLLLLSHFSYQGQILALGDLSFDFRRFFDGSKW